MSKACNCLSKTKIKTGDKFGRLEIIENVGIVKGNTSFKCKCDCGNAVIIVGYNLKSGHTQSCGCLQREQAAFFATKFEINAEMINQKYGILEVLEINTVWRGRYKRFDCICKCDCGNIVVVDRSNLRNGHTKSCGCLLKRVVTTHGRSRTPIYKIWESMIQRCCNPKHSNYKYYGGRGILVCQEWLGSFENFYRDVGERPKNLTLERVNNNLGYSKENCIWASRTDQSRNQRSHCDSKTGHRGVYLNISGKKYTAQIKVDKKTKHIGTFNILQDAIIARQDAEQKYWGVGVKNVS